VIDAGITVNMIELVDYEIDGKQYELYSFDADKFVFKNVDDDSDILSFDTNNIPFTPFGCLKEIIWSFYKAQEIVYNAKIATIITEFHRQIAFANDNLCLFDGVVEHIAKIESEILRFRNMPFHIKHC
jgi:hypothetical protein